MAETGLKKVSDYFVPQVEGQLQRSQIQMTDYQKMCVTGAMQQIYQLIVDNEINPNEIQNNVSDILLTVAALQLNANAQPREVYFQTRNVWNKETHTSHKVIEMGIEGDGNDALLNRFGRNVAYVHPFWQVREGDKFEYPKHMGIKLTPPTWEPAGAPDKKVVKVVYPIDMYMTPDYHDGKERKITTEYFITEREQVKKNLLAHISNNLMRDKSDAKGKVKAFAKDHTLDQILDSDEMVKLGKISPAWREPQSRETMIIRKMRNNIVKKIPKDFNNGLAQVKYEEATNESYKEMRRDVTEEANTEDFDRALEDHTVQQSPSQHAKQESEFVDPEMPDGADKATSDADTPEQPQTPAKDNEAVDKQVSEADPY